MTHRSLSTPNSGLRVFSASLLSALMIMMPFVQLAAAEKRSEVRVPKAESGPQTADSRQQGTKNAAAENVFLNAPVPKPAPEPPALLPVISATKDDGLAAATTVAPGGTITYTVNINNTHLTDNATNVQFSDQVDAHTTLVPGSPVAAASDKYNAIGNVLLTIPDGATDLLGNDFDPDTGNNAGMTVTAETKSSTSCTGGCSNNVTINANGSFTYDPPVGFSGTDTFTYTAISGTSTATQTVTITVANEIWFINNNAGACPGAPCDGRLSHPFVSLAAFTAANLGGAGQPGDNDWIFVYESLTDYAGPATLRNGQKFIGQDATTSLAVLTGFPAPSGTDPLPVMNSGNGTFVNITGANVNGINLLSGNTLRGFRVGNVGTGTKISGTSFGTLLVGNSASPDVLLHGTGRALNLTTGTLSVTGGFVSVTTTSSSTQGISLSGVADSDGAGGSSFAFGSTTVSGSTTQGILIGTTPADLNFGATSVTGGTNGVSFQNNSAGTRTFSTLGISGSANEAFLHGAGGGNVTVTGAATLSSAGSAISVSAPASTNAINFQAATSATSTGAGITAVNWAGAANTSMTFNSLSITRNNGIALNASGGGTINVTNATGSITNTTSAGPAIVASNIALNANFLAINSSGGANGVSLTAVTGTSNLGSGQLTGTALGATFAVSAGTATVIYSGNITQAAAAPMVSIVDHTTGTITFQTGTLSATLGTGISLDDADGIYNFSSSGGTTTLNGGNAHIDIIGGATGTITFGTNTTVTNPSGVAVNINNASAATNVTYNGTISTNANRPVSIQNVGANSTISFTGNVTSTNNGILLATMGNPTSVTFSGASKSLSTGTNTAVSYTGATGNTVTFSNGGLAISRTTGAGVIASGGGTLIITRNAGAANTIGSGTSGTGLSLDGVTIGTGGLVFESIAQNGGSNGIFLQNTGTTAGLTIAGNSAGNCGGDADTNTGDSFVWSSNAANAADCTGGVIQNTTGGDGTSAGVGIFLNNTRLVNLTRVKLNDHSNHAIKMTSVVGFIANNLYITGANGTTAANDEGGIWISNLSGTTGAGTQTSFTQSTIEGGREYNVFMVNTTGTLDRMTFDNCTFGAVSATTDADDSLNIEATAGTTNITVDNSKLTNGRGDLLNFNIIGTAVSDVIIDNTTFSNNHASILSGGGGVTLAASQSGDMDYDVTNSAFRDAVGDGILVRKGFGGSPGDGTMEGTINNNRFGVSGVVNSGSSQASAIEIGVLARGHHYSVVTNNTIYRYSNYGILVEGTSAGVSGLPAHDAELHVTIQGNTIAEPNAPGGGLAQNGIHVNMGTASNTPTGPADAYQGCLDIGGAGAEENSFVGSSALGGTDFRLRQRFSTTIRLPGYVGGNTDTAAVIAFIQNQNTGTPTGTASTQAPGGGFVGGANCSQPSAFFKPEKLNRGYEVASIFAPSQSVASAANALVQMLTAVANENRASSASISAPSQTHTAPAVASSHRSSDDKRSTTVARDPIASHHASTENAKAERKTVSEQQPVRSHHATTSRALAAPMSGETVTANIGTLPAGGSVTITFQVTVDNPPNLTLLGPPRVENQGTVTFNEVGSPVLTDDPNFGGAADKTRTLIDLFDTTTTLASNLNPSNSGDNVTFTATINETPVQGSVNPTGTVDFIDTNNGNAVICNDVVVAASAAQCQTALLTSGTHDIQAVYSGDGNFDGSNSNIVSQVVIPCVTNPVVDIATDEDDADCVSGDCSLREAIKTVCSGTTITFDTGGVFSTPQTIALTLGELSVTRTSSLVAPTLATQHVTVSGSNLSRVFSVASGKTFNINNLTITGGAAGSNGAVYTLGGTANLFKSTVSGNLGGGVFVDGSGVVGMAESTISGNSSAGGGAGIYCDNSTLYMTNSTVSGNTTPGAGGGIAAYNGCIVTSVNVTISNNTADDDNNATGAGGGIFNGSGTVGLYNTIVAGNFNENGVTDAFDDVNGALFASSSFNLIGDGTGMTGITHASNGNQVGTLATPINALLGLLADNGGPTFTHALLTGSPAIEAGSNTNATNEALTTDQRGVGYPRIADSADLDAIQTVDIGAFELHPSVEDITDKTTAEDTAVPQITFNLGDGTGALISTVTATSGNTTLVPNGNLVIGGAGSTRTLDISPAADANTPADGTATITVTVTATNGRTAVDTFVVTVTEVNDAPVPTNDTVPDVAEDSGTYVIPFATLLANDTNKGAANESGQTLNITAVSSPTGGLVVINGTNVEFTPTANFFGPAGFTYTVTDDGTTNTVLDAKTGNATVSFNVTAVNDPPSFTIAADPPAVNEDAGAQTVINFATSISEGPGESGQTPLTFNLTPGATTGTLTFSSGPAIDGSGTLTYTPTADTNGTASFSVTLSDTGSNTPPNSNTSAAQTFTITVNAQNDAPVVTTTGANLAYAEGDPATAVDTGLTVTDSDSANLTGGSASITANFQSGQDVLGWVDNNLADSITLDGSSTAQTIVLTGTGTPANYQAALRAVTYQNSSENPSTLTRTVTFTANDGTNTGQGTRNIDVSAANDSPTLTTNAGLTVLNSGTGTIDNTKLKVDDVDNTATQLTFTVGTATTNGTLKKGVATLSAGGTFTQDDIDNNLITYTHGGAGASDSFTFTVSDGAGGSIGSTTFNITIGDPDVRIHDAKVAEPASPSTVDMVFTVALSSPAAEAISVNFTTNNGSAIAGTCGNPGADYVLTSGTVNFAIGEQVKTINVPVCSDAVADDGETFTVTLSAPVNVNIVDGTATGTITANTAGTVLISELRTSGPGGAGDDFVEIYNNTDSPLTVAASDASAGYGLYKMGADCNAAPILIGVIPNSTVIPARGHYLFVGSAYSLTNYGGTGAAAGNLTFSSDIETDANVGLFTTSDVISISSANRLDAVGFGVNTGGACNLLREASTLPPIAGNATIEHSYFRKMCDWLQGQGCTVPGVPKDTNNNANDFWLADTAGSAITGRLGAPGPENIASPIRRDNSGINVVVLDGTVSASAAPNRDRNGGDPAGLFGTMKLRYRVTNNTGAPVTRLRYRIVDMSTAIQPPGPTADLRALTSSIESVGPVNDTVTCTADGAGAPPCTVTVTATTLETPPNQAIGGGYNSTLSSGTITTLTPLPNNQSILIHFKLGVQKTGTFRFYIIVEALP